MEFYYRQAVDRDTHWSFPVRYKKLRFDRPTKETRALMKILRSNKPDFFFSLHNSQLGGAYYFINKDIGKTYYNQFYRLLKSCNIPLHLGEPEADYLEEYSRAIYQQAGIKETYDYIAKHTKEPGKRIQFGANSFDWLMRYNRGALTFICELPYMLHPLITSSKKTKFNRRRLSLKNTADYRYFASVIIEEFEKIKNSVNSKSLFYHNTCKTLERTKRHLAELSKDVLFSPDYNRVALESELIDMQLSIYHDLCWHYQVVRLLLDSRQTPKVKTAIKNMRNIFADLYNEVDRAVDFKTFEIIDLNNLVKAQLGSGMIALNWLMKAR